MPNWCANLAFSLKYTANHSPCVFTGMGGAAIAPPTSLVEKDKERMYISSFCYLILTRVDSEDPEFGSVGS